MINYIINMFRLFSYILNSKLIDESESTLIAHENSEHSSSAQSESNPESDVPDEEKSELEVKPAKVKQSKSTDDIKNKVDVEESPKSCLPSKAKAKKKISKTSNMDTLNDSEMGIKKASVAGSSESSKSKSKIRIVKPLKMDKNKTNPGKQKLTDKKVVSSGKGKTRIDFTKQEVKCEKRKIGRPRGSPNKEKQTEKVVPAEISDSDSDNIPLKKLKLQTESSETTLEKSNSETEKVNKDIEISKSKQATPVASEDESKKIVESNSSKNVQSERGPSKRGPKPKVADRPSSLALSSSHMPKSPVHGTPKKPKSEIDRLKELEAQMAAKKPKLKMAKNIVKELKEKDIRHEKMLKAKTGEIFTDESPIPSNVSESLESPQTTTKIGSSEPNASSSYDDVKSPSTGTITSCVSPCFSEESRPSVSASQKEDSNDGFNQSVDRSISPSNSESTVTETDGQRSRPRKRSLLSKGKKKSSSASRRSSRSVSEDGSMESPGKLKRIPKRTGIIFEIGYKLEAMDFQEKWYMAKIVEIDQEKAEILIHFDGWSSRYDEWISMHSKKLRAVAQPFPGKRDPREKSCQFKVNERVLARWTDGKMYSATVKEVHSDNYYLVEFFDGFVRRLPYTCIAKVPTDFVEKLIHPIPIAAVKKLQTDEEISKDPILKTILNRSSTDDDSSLNSPNTSFVPKKQFKVEEDHNQFKCHFEKCNKSFRKESLLASHIKHYHRPKLKPKPRAHSLLTRKIKKEDKGSPVKSIEEPEALCHAVKEEIETEVKIEAPNSEVTDSLVTSEEVNEVKDESDVKTPLKASTSLDADVQPVPISSPLIKGPLTSPSKLLFGKGAYPITKMETRHAKLRFQKDDSVYTNYKTVALGIQRPRRTSEGKNDKMRCQKDFVKGEHRTPGRSKSNSESSSKPTESKQYPSCELKKSKNKSEKKTDAQISKGDGSKKLKLERVDEESQDKKESIGPVTRRRSDRCSESTTTSKAEEGAKDEVDDGIDLNDDLDDRADNDEVVHCICEINEENGLMIQCEICLTWQHALCFKIDDQSQVPDKYICYACTNPRGLRSSFKYRLDQEWFKSGELPTFNDMGTNCKQSCSILAGHELVSSMHNIVNVLHSLDYKINLTKDSTKANSDLRHFSQPWKSLSASNESLNESTLTAKTSNLDTELTLDAETTERVLKAIADEGISDPKGTLLDESYMTDTIRTTESTTPGGFASLDHSYFSVKQDKGLTPLKQPIISLEDKAQQERANLNSACSSTDSTTATTTTEDTMDGLDQSDFPSTSGQIKLDTPFPEEFSDSETELRVTTDEQGPQTESKPIKTKISVVSAPRRRGRARRGAHLCRHVEKIDPLPKVEENINVEVCRENLLDHITDVQNNLETKLYLIEGQLKILEAEYGEDTSDQDQYMADSEDDDLPKLLQSIKNLSNDLTLVERLAVL